MKDSTTITSPSHLSTTQSSVVISRTDQSLNLISFTLIIQILRSQVMNSFDRGIMFIAPTLISLLQVKYQGSVKSPFDTHRWTMTIAIGTLLVYFVAYAQPFRFSLGCFSSAGLAKRCKVWSGNVSVALLASVFLPDPIRPFLYVISVALSEPEVLIWLSKKAVEGSKELWRRYFSRVFDRFTQTHSSETA